ncbi:hypothetical protein CRG98_047183 [Punica granatum]|uniref:Uncharacterized protein n=1 Tax=Punica granatum TaxID=22663 RepID=A0A2I0HLR3_PUNGR|nr:hypothetical protein CRG98_047183 [Punica granatum]
MGGFTTSFKGLKSLARGLEDLVVDPDYLDSDVGEAYEPTTSLTSRREALPVVRVAN